MYGQMKLSSKHQDIVKKYIAENNPYEAREPLRFNLRSYDAYMREHGITDPDQIPDEIIAEFTGSEQKTPDQSSQNHEYAV